MERDDTLTADGHDDTAAARQQLEHARRIQVQAEQRVQLGLQLFKAAEAHALRHRDMIQQLKDEQQELHQQLQQDVAQSLHEYDQWVGQLDENFTTALRQLDSKVDSLQERWAQTESHIEQMMKRSEALLDQSRVMLEHTAAHPPLAQRRHATTDEGESPEVVVRPGPSVYREALSKLRTDEDGPAAEPAPAAPTDSHAA